MDIVLLIIGCVFAVLIAECMINAKDWFEEMIEEEEKKDSNNH